MGGSSGHAHFCSGIWTYSAPFQPLFVFVSKCSSLHLAELVHIYRLCIDAGPIHEQSPSLVVV